MFYQEKALVGAISVIVKTGCGTDGAQHSTSSVFKAICDRVKCQYVRFRSAMKNVAKSRMIKLLVGCLMNWKLRPAAMLPWW